METIKISKETAQKILNHLGTRPLAEVINLFSEFQTDIQQLNKPEEKKEEQPNQEN